MDVRRAPSEKRTVLAAPFAEAALEALSPLLTRAEEVGYAGWDPFDALTSPMLHATCRTALLRRVAIQFLKRSPLNVRPALRIAQRSHTKGVALFASAYARLSSLDVRYEQRAVVLADRLVDLAIQRNDGVAWSYDFDVQTRWGYYKAGEPNAVATAFVAHALLDVDQASGKSEYAAVVEDALGFACSSLSRAEGFFAYTASSSVPIHNANVLIAAIGARCAKPRSEMWSVCSKALSYTLQRQRPNGSWPYGEARSLDWVDGFHTGYVLQSCAAWNAGEVDVGDAIARGASFYAACLVDPDGAPRATPESRYPVETHAAATAISTFASLSELDEQYWRLVERLVSWALSNLQRSDGRYVYRVHRAWTNRIPYVRWSDGHMALALADVLWRVRP